MKKTVTIRGLSIGEGAPKICVPMVGETIAQLMEEAKLLQTVDLDIVEWRVDFFEQVEDFDRVRCIILFQTRQQLLIDFIDFQCVLDGSPASMVLHQSGRFPCQLPVYKNGVIGGAQQPVHPGEGVILINEGTQERIWRKDFVDVSQFPEEFIKLLALFIIFEMR